MTKNLAMDVINRAKGMELNTLHSCAGEKQVYESCLNALPLLVVIVDRGGSVVWLNHKASEITGFDNTAARGKLWFDPKLIDFHCAVSADDAHARESGKAANLVLSEQREKEKVISGWFLPLEQGMGEDSHIAFVSSSVCETQSALSEVCITGYDELTGLAGRNMAYEQLKHSMAKAKREYVKVGVIFLDVDDFKRINDSYGHAAGDLVLRTVADRLKSTVRESDTVARIGGDEFLIILNEIDDEMDCEVVAEKIVDVFSRTIEVGGQAVLATTSMGIAIYPGDGRTYDEIVGNADAAMYYAKKNGKNKFHYFTNEINKLVEEKQSLEHMLKDAVKKHGFSVVYQPIVEADTGMVEQLEALVRWEHDGKLVLPSGFLAVAEESGIIVPIGEDVMYTACKDAAVWSELAGKDICVTVNVSLRQWLSGGIPRLVREVMDDTGLSPSCLQLEITEKSLFHKFEYVYKQLMQLCDMGVSLSLDDFGVGYSSLSCIDKVPLGTVKIDGSKVHGISRGGGGLTFCEAVTSMTHSYSKKVVAEEVESARQLRYLRGIGVDYVQGSYISEPLHRDAVNYLFS